jgi:death-on-curing protein
MREEDIRFLSIAEAIVVHDEAIERYGGAHGLARPNALEGSMMAVEATWDGELLLGSLAEIAAAYAFYISTSHAFVDGNKRTGLGIALTFLTLNGYDDMLDNFVGFQDVMVDVAQGLTSHDVLSKRFAAAMGEWNEIE